MSKPIINYRRKPSSDPVKQEDIADTKQSDIVSDDKIDTPEESKGSSEEE